MTDSLTGAGVRYRWMQHFRTEAILVSEHVRTAQDCIRAFHSDRVRSWIQRWPQCPEMVAAYQSEGTHHPCCPCSRNGHTMVHHIPT